jgi:hypothetical protein
MKRRRTAAAVTSRPIAAGIIEIHTRCPHAGYRLGETITARVATAMSIAHHAMTEGCDCMTALWRRYRTPQAPADLGRMVRRFQAFWAGAEAQQRRQGHAVVDTAAALEAIRGPA